MIKPDISFYLCFKNRVELIFGTEKHGSSRFGKRMTGFERDRRGFETERIRL